jgi:DNA repair exonuclease SbcCD ATPase subunit
MGTPISEEDFKLPLQFLSRSSDGIEIRSTVEVIAHLEDVKVFKQKFIFEPSKYDALQLAEHLSELKEIKELVNAEFAAYSARYLVGERDVANQIGERLTRPISAVLKDRGLNLVEIERLSQEIVKRPLTGTSPANKGNKIWHLPFILTSALALILIAGFIFYYFQMSGKVALLQGELTSINARATSLQNEKSAFESQVASLKSELSSSQSNFQTTSSQLQSQIASAKSQITSLQNDVSSYQSQASSLQSQLLSTKAQISTLQDQLSSANDRISSLQSGISDLQNIVSLSKSTNIVNEKTINQSEGQSTSVASFAAQYAGYVVVSGTSTTSNGYLIVTDSFGDSPLNSFHYPFGTGATCTIPVLPGTVTVYFANSNSSGGATATLTVIYCY